MHIIHNIVVFLYNLHNVLNIVYIIRLPLFNITILLQKTVVNLLLLKKRNVGLYDKNIVQSCMCKVDCRK